MKSLVLVPVWLVGIYLTRYASSASEEHTDDLLQQQLKSAADKVWAYWHVPTFICNNIVYIHL